MRRLMICNQFHALDDSFLWVTDAQRKTPTYALAVTHKKELAAIFKRLWKFKDDQPQRDQHLDLLAAELKELRETAVAQAMLQMADGAESAFTCV